MYACVHVCYSVNIKDLFDIQIDKYMFQVFEPYALINNKSICLCRIRGDQQHFVRRDELKVHLHPLVEVYVSSHFVSQ